jgi:hypothetical protein
MPDARERERLHLWRLHFGFGFVKAKRNCRALTLNPGFVEQLKEM